MSTQVEEVRRRLVYAQFKTDIDSAVMRFAWNRDGIIDSLLICDGDMHVLNEHWRRWRRMSGDHRPHGRESQRSFIAYLKPEESLRKAAASLQETA